MGSRITLRDVAARAGISLSQASFALSGTGRVSAETSERVHRAAAELSYAPDARARGLRTGRSGTYGVVIRNLRNPYFLDVLRGMERTADNHGASLVIVSTDYDPDREAAAIRKLSAQGVSGIAISPIGDETLSRWRTLTGDIPIVGFNWSPQRPGSIAISPDGDEAVSLAVAHLAELGHARASLLAAPEDLVADSGRERAFTSACENHGIEARILRSPLRLRDVEEVIARVCADGAPPPFILNSDYLATAVYRVAKDRRERIGREISVIGHDDLPTSAFLDPPLTSISFDREQLGRAIMARLVDGAPEADPDERHPVSLIVRASVADLR